MYIFLKFWPPEPNDASTKEPVSQIKKYKRLLA